MYSENNMRIRCNGCSRVRLTYLICSVAEPPKILYNEMWRLNGNGTTFQIQTKRLTGKEKQQLLLFPHVSDLCRKCRRLQQATASRGSGISATVPRLGVESRGTTPQGPASHTLLAKFYGSGRGMASCNSYAPCGEAQCNHVTRRGVSHKHIAGKLVLLGMLRNVRLVENSRNPRRFITAFMLAHCLIRNNYFPSMPRSSKWFLTFKHSDRTFVWISHLMETFYGNTNSTNSKEGEISGTCSTHSGRIVSNISVG
jgi:hypothetical protein